MTETSPALNLDNPSHRLALLEWLNSWGCRQFAKNFHNTASENVQQWGRFYVHRLPPIESNLVEMDSNLLNVAVEAYDNLKERQACIRRSKTVTFGSTGAAKIMYAVRPSLFPPWDAPIRKQLKYDGSSESYCKFLKKVQEELNNLITDAARCGVGLDDPRCIGSAGVQPREINR